MAMRGEAQALRVLYGGTFDPVHLGHVAVARAARDALDAIVAFMPAADPPHRAPPGAPAVDRAAMLDLAIAGEPGLALDLRELERAGRSWTVDTLRDLRAMIGDDAPVALLVGADSFDALPTWKEWRALFDLAHFVVAGRAGISPGAAPLPATGSAPQADGDLAEAIAGRMAGSADALRASPAGRVFRLRQPLFPHSASEVRARIAAGQPWDALVPVPVARYIHANGLYGAVPRPG
ncbi:MAG TPA: nicotinate-nucleotide adenylyltransferase [Luteimonas sp.]|nr:nicotinate-nucleotide adenylyltransferase [Luteimonas sp.]